MVKRYIVWIKWNGKLWPQLVYDNLVVDGKGTPVYTGVLVRIHEIKEEHRSYSFRKLRVLYTAYN